MTNPLCHSNFFIFTGGPGSGKTAVLEELEQRGYRIVPEVARDIIKQQQKIAGYAMHTGDRKAFLDLMLKQSILDYQSMQSTETAVFFDRGIPDLYAYAEAFVDGVTIPIQEAVDAMRYNKTVFLFPPWEEIYTNDQERQQDFAEAVSTYNAIKQAYLSCSYELLELPKIPVQQRVDFILQHLIQINLTELKNDLNALLGFHEGTPRINYGPCGVFAKLFFDAWNSRFKEKVHIVFVMMANQEECWHVAIRLPTGQLYDGGLGVHEEASYGEGYVIEDMYEYDHARLEKWSYGLDRDYPRFCPNFDKEKVHSLIEFYLNMIKKQ